MKQVNNISTITKIIYFIDIQILKILSSKEVDEDKLSTLTDIRILYIEELNSIISSNNTSDMYDKKYYESFRRP